MKRRDFISIAALMSSGTLFGMNRIPGNFSFSPPVSTGGIDYIKRFGDGRDWFFEKRFGMFVHWGIYAIPAVQEQYMLRYNISRKEYEKFARLWNPVDFDPDRWLDLMQEAGMKYLTFTTKHHDGFCMWDTKQTSFNVMNTPYKKDILGMLADACHKRNIPLSLYYSIVDWHNPYYPNKGRHHELPPQPGDTPDWGKYMEFVKAQVRELCTNYGEIHGFWWDMNVPEYKDPSINEMIQKLQPNAVINNRGFDEGDFGTPERDYSNELSKAKAFTKPTEACQSVGMQSWGYRKDEDYYTDRYLKMSIDSYLSRGANYLLNVGPDAKGVIPAVSAGILQRIGKWYKKVDEAYQDVELVTGKINNNYVLLTAKDNTLYVHLNKLPIGNTVSLYPLKTLPDRAILLNTGKTLKCISERKPYEIEAFLWIQDIPVNDLSNEIPVIKLEFNKPLNELLK
ncbi:MAG: glycoside hydrolase [Chlorobi bacterium]|nr:glycoside hydrolase [Chlorobiota bacterium]